MQIKKKKKESKPTEYSSTVNDIINKIKDTQEVTDKKLEELSQYCLGKNCSIKN
jgi:flagellar hook-basal body complex protein FliE